MILRMPVKTSTINRQTASKFVSLTHFCQLSSNNKSNFPCGIFTQMSQRCIKGNMSKRETMTFFPKPAVYSELMIPIRSYSATWSVNLSRLISTCQPLDQPLSVPWLASVSQLISNCQPLVKHLSAAWSALDHFPLSRLKSTDWATWRTPSYLT